MNTKICSKCNATRARQEYSVNSATGDGLDYWCKSCRRAYYESRRALKNPIRKPGQCRRCMLIKPESEWGRDKTYCKACRIDLGRAATYRKFGISEDQFVEMERGQRGLCAICMKPESKNKRLCIDHDHSCCPGTGSCGKCIRGLICFKCNVALGMVNDDEAILSAMLTYLDQSSLFP